MRLLNENHRVNSQLRDIIPNFVLLKKSCIKLKVAYLFPDTISIKVVQSPINIRFAL